MSGCWFSDGSSLMSISLAGCNRENGRFQFGVFAGLLLFISKQRYHALGNDFANDQGHGKQGNETFRGGLVRVPLPSTTYQSNSTCTLSEYAPWDQLELTAKVTKRPGDSR